VAKTCTHLSSVRDVIPSGEGCQECLASGAAWFHLRICMACGHVGCCDQSPGRHATKHHRATDHPIIRSFEPGEDWLWCYPDELLFELGGVPALYHP
jgi:uncharacterized UBP type Zn finger protein